jgi:imidazole glycerol-phosphate synthase subunit HisH
MEEQKPEIAIIDYGVGNIFSVKKAIEFYGVKTKVTCDPEEIASSRKIVLPGVGSFGDAMYKLEEQGLVSIIKKEANSGKPLLGICLGMQLLFDRSQESTNCGGLGLIEGEVKKFDNTKQKVPHMGWNQLEDITSSCPFLRGILEDSYVYFCHSYYAEPRDKSVIAATCDYGVKFSAAIWQKNIFGAQFHPEKSQSIGLRIIENFVKLG